MSARQQLLALALLVVVVLPLGITGVAGNVGLGPLEWGTWILLVVGLVVAIFTWGRGPRDSRGS